MKISNTLRVIMAFLLLASLVLVGCGKKADPRPPQKPASAVEKE